MGQTDRLTEAWGGGRQSVLFYTSINNLDDGIGSMLIKFIDVTELGGTAIILGQQEENSNEINKLQKWFGEKKGIKSEISARHEAGWNNQCTEEEAAVL